MVLRHIRSREGDAMAKGSSAGAGAGGAVMFLGFIGALVYYWQQAHGFWEFVLGVLEACVWPALLVYQLLSHTHA